jgi:hypothetical protein
MNGPASIRKDTIRHAARSNISDSELSDHVASIDKRRGSKRKYKDSIIAGKIRDNKNIDTFCSIVAP